jgi:endonuclease/exonuclease/phosphatase family metal-dependent hydrolase
LLATKVQNVTSDGTFSSGERDVLIAGDFNASRYDNYLENLWTNLSPTRFNFRTLSPDDGEEYPGTRLAGVPLAPTSQIDFILASARAQGLVDELAEPFAQVRVDLLPSDFSLFRRHLSDHIPVTIRIRLVPDDDP